MRSIPIDVVRAFIAVVEARGFTRAAEALGRSQPTISLQVKRLEELVEAPLFERVARFELTAVGAVCFDYGKRLIRLHDEMLDEAERRKAPGAVLRIGMPGEFAARLTPRLDSLRSDAESGAGFEVVTGDAEALAGVFRQNGLDLAVLVGAEETEFSAGRWSAPLAWYVRPGDAPRLKPPNPIRLVVTPQGAPLHEAAVSALRAAGRSFEIACASADFSVRAAAVAAGLGIAPMIEGLAPEGLQRAEGRGLPALPPLLVSVAARGEKLAAAARRWAAAALPPFEPA